MKLFELFEFNGNNQSLDPDNIDETINIIVKNCADKIKTFKKINRLLYSGRINPWPNDINFLTSPTNRIPQLLSVDSQEFLDKLILKLGGKALRSNSLYTTSSLREASSFGRAFVIIPYDNSNFTWSRNIQCLMPYVLKNTNLSMTDSTVEQWQNALQYDFTDLIGALDSKHEVYISGNFVALRVRSSMAQEVLKKLGLYDILRKDF